MNENLSALFFFALSGSARRAVTRLHMSCHMSRWFGKQFHRRNTLNLGEPFSVAVVLKDKCGNVIKDRKCVAVWVISSPLCITASFASNVAWEKSVVGAG